MPHVSRRVTIKALGALGAALVPAPFRANAQNKTTVSVLTSPAGSGPYDAWGVLQTRSEDSGSPVRIQAVETPGFVYNVNYLAKTPNLWKSTVIGSGSVLEWAAKVGMKPFFQSELKEASNYRTIGVMGLTGTVWVTTDESIRSVDDLASKRIATGLLTQNEWGMYPRMILDGLDLTPKLRALNPLGTDKNVEALLDGRSDVATLVAYSNQSLSETILPGPFKLMEAAPRAWHYVSVPKERIEAFNKKHGSDFHVRRYPPNTLPNQPSEVTTYGNYLLLTAHKDFPDDHAYEIAKLWMKMGPVVARYNAFGKIWDAKSIADAAARNPDQVHPGALRAYKEAGLVS